MTWHQVGVGNNIVIYADYDIVHKRMYGLEEHKLQKHKCVWN